MGEQVDAVDHDAWRTAEPCALRVLDRFDTAALNHHFGMILGESAEVSVGLEPVRAVIEVEQCHLHASTVDLQTLTPPPTGFA